MSYSRIDRCRSCLSPDLREFLDLGKQPLANAFPRLDDEAIEATYPLVAIRCGTCSLVQLEGSVDPTELFDEYLYFSSYSDGMTSSSEQLASRIIRELSLDSNAFVVEVASNDGYLLRHYKSQGVRVLGIEPAANVAAVAELAGIPTRVAYFDGTTANEVRAESGCASVIHVNNVLAHVPDINGFVAGLATLAGPAGLVVVETPWLIHLVAEGEFDTIYHEHIFYYSLTALEPLFNRHGLRVVDIEKLQLHGGSLRLYLTGSETHEAPAVDQIRAEELGLGVTTDAYYADFALRVASIKEATMAVLRSAKAEGQIIAGYGAAAKGTVLLNHFGIGTEFLDYVVDRNPYKLNRRVPGLGIPICEPERLLRDRPDLVFLLAWNFADEILAQQSAYRRAGGRFLIPIPDVRIT